MYQRCPRRQFLKMSAACAGGAFLALSGLRAGGSLLPDVQAADSSTSANPLLKEVMYYQKLPDGSVKCEICPKYCLVREGSRGYCGNKENQAGYYYNLAYSWVCARNLDPIEKKPLFHYRPGETAMSLATAGCNFECKYCQNWQISQAKPEALKNKMLLPDQVIRLTRNEGSSIVALTYSEPVVFYEYMYDIARVGRKQGIESVMVSNGFINEKPLIELCRYLRAVKIDLKSFSDRFYREYCNGRLQPVLDTLVTLKKTGIWFEIVVLVIPTLNDSPEELKELCTWVKETLGPDVPLHFSRFHPQYKLTTLPPTPVKTIQTAWEIGRSAGLNYVYTGNVTPHPGESTYCPKCHKVLIKRIGYLIKENNLIKGQCKYCQQAIAGVWEKE